MAGIAEGEGGVLVAAGRRWTREGTFNRVIATGENTGETAPASSRPPSGAGGAQSAAHTPPGQHV